MAKIKIVATITETETKKIVYELDEEELIAAVENDDTGAEEALQGLNDLRNTGKTDNETDLYLYCRDCCEERFSSSKYYEYGVDDIQVEQFKLSNNK